MCACMCMCLSLICISVTPLYTIQCMKCEMKQMLVPNTANLNMIYGADAVCGYGLYHFWKINSQTVPYHVVAATSCLLRSIKYTLGMHTKMCVRIQVCVCNVFQLCVSCEFTGKTKYRGSQRNSSAPYKNVESQYWPHKCHILPSRTERPGSK